MVDEKMKYISNSTGKKMILFGIVLKKLQEQVDSLYIVLKTNDNIEEMDKLIYDYKSENSILYRLALLKELSNCTLHIDFYTYIGRMIYRIRENEGNQNYYEVLEELKESLENLTKELLSGIEYMQGYNLDIFIK